MKIAILTQPLYNNYGGILQNYALQTYLRRQGHETTTVNFAHTPLKLSVPHFRLSVGKRTLQKILGRDIRYIDPIRQDRETFRVDMHQQRFIATHIRKLDIHPPLTPEFCDQHHYDAYIVGSDQVWRPFYSPCITNFYLDFAQNSPARKIAYAASFGVDHWEAKPELTQTLAALAVKFNAISVRETSGVDLCRQYLNVAACHVIDPTMLLSAEDYLQLASSADTQESHIVSYILDYSPAKKTICESIAGRCATPLQRIGIRGKNGYQSIEDWLQAIAHARLVVTDSFHGTVFSILFNRPFITIANETRGETRLRSLLQMFGLESRLRSENTMRFDRLDTDNDWNDVNTRLEAYRTKAGIFLDQALKN